jgi:lipopolysaccharide heptosyltransferase II
MTCSLQPDVAPSYAKEYALLKISMPMKLIYLLKLCDALFGKTFCRLVPLWKGPKNTLNENLQKMLVIRPGGIGDAVLLIPVLRVLKEAYPRVFIDVLAEKRNGAIFSFSKDVDSVYYYDRPRDLKAVIAGTYDVVIDTEQWHRLSAAVARLTRAPIVLGYSTNERVRCFTHPVSYSHDDSEMESFFNLVKPLLGNNSMPVTIPFLSIPSQVSKKIEPLLAPLRNKTIIAIFPGGSTLQKRWDENNFRSVAAMLIKNGYGIVVLGGQDDSEAGRKMAEINSSILNFCGKLSLMETAALLKKVSLLISGDSGIMHISYGLGVKIVALFGPSNVKKWAPRCEDVSVIYKNLDCSPCSKFGYTPYCKHNTMCMKQITVDEVYEKAIELLER